MAVSKRADKRSAKKHLLKVASRISLVVFFLEAKSCFSCRLISLKIVGTKNKIIAFILSTSIISIAVLTVIFTLHPIAAETKPQPNPKIIELTGPVYLSKCVPCHRNLDAWKNPGLIFNHPVHLKRGFQCKACHLVFAHQLGGKIVKPPMDVCYDCHSLRHSEKGLVASEDCGFCHPKDFNLKPPNHTGEFEASKHKERAKTDVKYCMQEYPEGLEACIICHDDAFCTKCHVTAMPHPILWAGTHKEAKAYKADSSICHADRTFCQNCHHKFEHNLLVQENCDRCHPEYKIPFVAISNKGFKIHKAHFELTQTTPFDCPACHSLFNKFPKGTGCYSFEVCFQCHGIRKDGRLIAKWWGEDLCYFCHGKRP